ncbi:mannosyl-glycoprotein endo-beta-N-acetylglucosaminidase [Staphylococcus caeli]|uniref:Mannosyl-glycoprotein endo-beta-N-acetylglucosaminidase n=2 Tax=Staphylococcus caeli TaxID=2201815 RepID=A0A1D4PPZ9_9STAP|nr:mannosyl-glycoprotein endo-beta-N-acetylglucosaminidase [Staphylococcus caeli]SCT31807.1 mannosyl-glycoprotein endo-beta-N-acetylglucosaminidase [Staphylococcus caeli]
MANNKYPKGFLKISNKKDTVPKPGDIAVWHPSPGTIGWAGHTAVVVGPSTKSYFYSVDQNWKNSNNWSGSPGSLEKHSYVGVTCFIRPAYYPEKVTSDNSDVSKPDPKPDETPQVKKPKYINKEITKVKYTTFSENDQDYQEIVHYMYDENSQDRIKPPKGIYVRESNFFRGVTGIYKQRNKYMKPEEFPHAYVDREMAWHCRHTNSMYPGYEDYLVLEVCGAETANKREYLLNQLTAILYGLKLLEWQNVKLSKDALKLSPTIWRSMKDLTGFDMIVEGFPEDAKYDEVKLKLLENYKNIKKLMTETATTTTLKTTIKVKNPNANQSSVTVSKPGTKQSDKVTSTSNKPKISVETSKYTFANALNRQMGTNPPPQVNKGWGWYSASRSETSKAMSPSAIWKSGVQKYQMLDLGKYQGVPVAKLNAILKGKGKLHNQGKAFASACKKHNVNEIYLISHAFLESGNGTSNFASGRYGIYNFFGIAAYDYNPNYSINFARRQGWTTPAKAIEGGAKFVRNDFFNKGKNTLYRMRWNPRNPATMQYATDIRWASHQATSIYNIYKKVGLKGMYYIRDKYK